MGTNLWRKQLMSNIISNKFTILIWVSVLGNELHHSFFMLASRLKILDRAYEYEARKKTNFSQYIQKQPMEVFYIKSFS